MTTFIPGSYPLKIHMASERSQGRSCVMIPHKHNLSRSPRDDRPRPSVLTGLPNHVVHWRCRRFHPPPVLIRPPARRGSGQKVARAGVARQTRPRHTSNAESNTAPAHVLCSASRIFPPVRSDLPFVATTYHPLEWKFVGFMVIHDRLTNGKSSQRMGSRRNEW